MRGLIKKLITWSLREDERASIRGRTQLAPAGTLTPYGDRTETDILREELMNLNNKFMALCDHLGLYVTRGKAPEWEVEDIKGLKSKLAHTAGQVEQQIRQTGRRVEY